MAHMMRRVVHSRKQPKECPYPWILSSHISLEAAQAILEVYPEGVWYRPSAAGSAFLSSSATAAPSSKLQSSATHSYIPLDYVLMSHDIIQRRTLDELLWDKFKLILVAAECSSHHVNLKSQQEISPVHTILERILAHPGKKWWLRRPGTSLFLKVAISDT